ncbi:NEW3 domain-containing protein [Chloroflexota bacterium]
MLGRPDKILDFKGKVVIINKKICQLLLCVITIIFILSPCMVFAQEEKTDLTLRLNPGDYYRNTLPEEESIIYLELQNTGDIGLNNIILSSDELEGWLIEFEPSSIDYLSVGSSQTVDVTIKPPSTVTKGEYQISLIAETDETRKVISTYLRLEPDISIWLWVGIGVAVLVIAGFIIIYKRFG